MLLFLQEQRPLLTGIFRPFLREYSSVLKVRSQDQKQQQPQLGTCQRYPFSDPLHPDLPNPKFQGWGSAIWVFTRTPGILQAHQSLRNNEIRVFPASEPILWLGGLPKKPYDFILMGFYSFISLPYPQKNSKNATAVHSIIYSYKPMFLRKIWGRVSQQAAWNLCDGKANMESHGFEDASFPPWGR